MERPNQTDEQTTKEILLASMRSAAFWSLVAVVVGVLAIIMGGIFLLAIEDLHDFGISVLIVGLVLLFVAAVLSPRAIGSFLIGRRGRFGANVLVMTAAFFAIVVLVNFLFFRNSARFDVTYTRIFSLSPQTEKVLNSLENPVRAHLFVVPSSSNDVFVRQPAEDLLDEFERTTGKFSYRVVDPELNKSVALEYEVTRHPVVVFEDVDTGRRQQVGCEKLSEIPGCLNFVEQDFVTGILVSTAQEQKVVYLLTGHSERSASMTAAAGQADEEGFDFAIEGMKRDNYRVIPLNLRQATEVPVNAAVLLIPGPQQDLSESEFEILTEYIKDGGRIAALLDPGTPQTFVNLFAQWGVRVHERSLADAASHVAGELLTPLLQAANGQYISVANITIADQIDTTFFPEATALTTTLSPADMPPFIRFLPIANTTQISWLESNPEDVRLDSDDETLASFPVAAVVQATGTVDESERHPEAKFVIIGDSDFAKNFFYSSDDNKDLFLNSVNWLADDFELISIRPKLNQPRRLVLTTRETDVIKWSSWFLPPTIMILLGAFAAWRRR